MPALLAYLIAVGLLLGGGYGALNWLTAPEPAKLVRHHPRPKPETPPTYDAARESSTPREASAAKPDAATAQDISPVPQPPQINSRPTENAPSDRLANAFPPSRPARYPDNNAIAKATDERTAQGTSRRRARSFQSAASAGSEKTTETGTRSAVGLAGNHRGNHPLALMILRTIDFPDGSRQTQLIPYRGNARVMALEADD